MSPDVRDLLSDAAPPPRGADTDAILRRSAQIARRQRIAGGVAAALLVPAIVLGATQLTDRDRGVQPSDRVSSSPGVSQSPSAGPRGPLGVVAVPPQGSVQGADLDDGRRVVVTHAPNGDVTVVDIASPVEVRGYHQTLAWCAPLRRLVDATSGAQFDMHGGPASNVTRQWATTYRTEAVDATHVRVLGLNEPPGEAVGLGASEPCTEPATTLDVDGPASTVRAALATPPGSYVRLTGVVIVTPEGDAGVCDKAVARRCKDDRDAESEGAPIAGLPSDARGRAVAGIFLARRSGEGFADVVRSSAADLDPPARAVAYVQDMVKAGTSATEEGYILTIDEADMVTGDAETQYAYESDEEVPMPYDQVTIRNPESTPTQARTDDSTIYLLQQGDDPNGTRVTAEEFRRRVAGTATEPLLVELAWDRADGLRLASVKEIYIP